MKTRLHSRASALAPLAVLALTATLAACGGGEPEATAADDRVQPLHAAPAVVSPLLDDDGYLVPSAPSAEPADPGASTRSSHYASPEQAAMLEEALGTRAISVTVEPVSDAAGAVEHATLMAFALQAAHGLANDAPVLVRSSDPRLGAAAVHRLEDRGFLRVFLVTQ